MTNPVVVGAGLQGVSVALALAERGRGVTLLERNRRPLQEASLRNEGKLHLGLVYALDRSGRTPRRMLEGALTFAPLLDRWCGPLPWPKWRSEGFLYATMPDSQASPDELAAAYDRVKSMVDEVRAASPIEPHYAGGTLSWLWRLSPEPRSAPRLRSESPVFETQEVAIDPRLLCARLTAAVEAHPLIDLRTNTTVESAERHNGRFRIDARGPTGPTAIDATAVVNCTWSDRERIDATLGLPTPEPATSYRVKYQILVRPRQATPFLKPVTMVQGPYGDVVPLPDGLVYVSWYPESRTYFGIVPPEVPDDPDSDTVVAERTLKAIGALFPALADADVVSSLPGTIVAPATSDIGDPASMLHRRSDFGVTESDGWWSVDTGKLTTAPLLGDLTAKAVDAAIG